jgi:hypothetical protein
MTVPSPADLKKREAKLKEFTKRLTDEGKPQEKHVVAVVRSAIRQAWMKSDVKLSFLYKNTIPDMDPLTRTKWLYKCEICGNMFKQNEIEVDHRHTGGTKFTEVHEFEQFFRNVLMVSENDLQILCKADHATKTLSEVLGISFEEAVIEKLVIGTMKESAKNIDSFLAQHGVSCARNKDARRIAVRGVLTKLGVKE